MRFFFSHIENQKQVLNSQTPSSYHIIFFASIWGKPPWKSCLARISVPPPVRFSVDPSTKTALIRSPVESQFLVFLQDLSAAFHSLAHSCLPGTLPSLVIKHTMLSCLSSKLQSGCFVSFSFFFLFPISWSASGLTFWTSSLFYMHYSGGSYPVPWIFIPFIVSGLPS